MIAGDFTKKINLGTVTFAEENIKAKFNYFLMQLDFFISEVYM